MTGPSPTHGDTPSRTEREAQFHDERFEGGGWRPATRFYDLGRRAFRAYGEEVRARAGDGDALEYGSGPAGLAFELAEKGTRMSAIDISEVAIRQARERAEAEGLSDRLDFRVMDAEALEFESGSLDLIFGSGILHHLDLDKSLRELRRTLRPDGAAVFLEPMGHNPALNLYRRLTPSQRTPDEHPLLMSDLAGMERHFGRVEPSFFHMTSALALPLHGRPSFGRALALLDRFDERVFRAATFTRRYAWMVVLALSEPRAAPAGA